jgi:hypothetical protein
MATPVHSPCTKSRWLNNMGLSFGLSDGTTMMISPDLGSKLLRIKQTDATGVSSGGVEIPFDDLKDITKKIADLVKVFI